MKSIIAPVVFVLGLILGVIAASDAKAFSAPHLPSLKPATPQPARYCALEQASSSKLRKNPVSSAKSPIVRTSCRG